MTDVSRPTPGPRAPRWMKIALGLSLALNLAVVGMAAGAAWRFHAGDGSRGPVRDLGFGPFAAALAPADREEMRDRLFEDREGLRRMRAEMRADFQTMLAALRAEPFDAAIMQAVLDRQRSRGMRMAERGSRLMAERIAAMDAAERRAFADRLEEGLTRRRGHGDHGRGHRD